MKVKIEGGGHSVELECADDAATPGALVGIVERAWQRTKSPERQQIGYGAQSLERTHDRPVAGAGDYQRQVRPVTA